MKKVISLMLVLAMLLCVVPAASAETLPFTDLAENAWYTQYVQYVYDHSLMNGVTDITFDPDSQMTRGMVVTVLYRVAGEPAASGSHPFADVESGAWFETPAVWGYTNKIVNGTSETTFEPDTNVTREMLVTLFYRYAKAAGYDVSLIAQLSAFDDADQVDSYAAEPFGWAVAHGIITGKDATHLVPNGEATRAECATMLQRLDKWINNQTTTPPVPSDPSTTAEQQAALDDALSYLEIFAFSYEKLVSQLEYDGHAHDAAVYAADNCGADWYEQALLSAQSYLEFISFSYQGLYDQLIYEKFTPEQAKYGVDNCGADWTEQALKKAKGYLESSAFSYEGLYDQLLYEEFTEVEAKYAVDNCGADWYEQAVKCAAEYLEYRNYNRADLIDQLEYEGFTPEQAAYGVTQNGL